MFKMIPLLTKENQTHFTINYNNYTSLYISVYNCVVV